MCKYISIYTLGAIRFEKNKQQLTNKNQISVLTK